MTGTGTTGVLTFLSRNLVTLFMLLISLAGLLCFMLRVLLTGKDELFFSASTGLDLGSTVPK